MEDTFCDHSFLFSLVDAGKELKKLRGDVPNELAQNFSSPATRNRRPGILGYV